MMQQVKTLKEIFKFEMLEICYVEKCDWRFLLKFAAFAVFNKVAVRHLENQSLFVCAYVGNQGKIQM